MRSGFFSSNSICAMIEREAYSDVAMAGRGGREGTPGQRVAQRQRVSRHTPSKVHVWAKAPSYDWKSPTRSS